ncbi:hypothetical protein CEXT_91961 [Caerostris extrusa]|uniref:Uncharacterized protein n=1 Tax=Caerostris extrusa TaxID=172846 RepID=A0AAV4SE01_CAEEX|nr:hypothetical protein CEXT_91961 [Caerostris extrusa]
MRTDRAQERDIIILFGAPFGLGHVGGLRTLRKRVQSEPQNEVLTADPAQPLHVRWILTTESLLASFWKASRVALAASRSPKQPNSPNFFYISLQGF